MKKLLVLALAIIMLVSCFAVAASATVYEKNNLTDLTEKLKFSVDSKATAPTIDGTVSTDEYFKIEYSKDNLYYIADEQDGADNVAASLALMKNTTVSFYATYDADNMYFAWEVPVTNDVYVSHDKADANRAMHAEASLLIRIGDEYVITEGNAEAPKIGIARLKSNGQTIATMFQTAGTFADATIADLGYATTYINGVLTYEMRIPASVFHLSMNDKFNAGEKIAFSWMATIGGDPVPTNNQWLKQRMICLGSGVGDSASTTYMTLLELVGTAADNGNSGNTGNTGSTGSTGNTGSTGSTGSTGNTNNETETKAPETTAAPETATDTVAEDTADGAKGCGGYVAASGMAIVAVMSAGAIVVRRKRK